MERRWPSLALIVQGHRREGTLIWPTASFGQEPVVKVGDPIAKKQLLARGITHIYFQADIGLLFLVGILMGIGSAAVYKHAPSYYPYDVGTVSGSSVASRKRRSPSSRLTGGASWIR